MLKLKKTLDLDEEAREWFRKLENGDEEALALWQWFRDESLRGIQPPLQLNYKSNLTATTEKPSTTIRWMLL